MRKFPLIGILLLIPALAMFTVVGCTKKPPDTPPGKDTSGGDDKGKDKVGTTSSSKRAPITTATTGTIKGIVKYKGTPPEPRFLDDIKKHKEGPLCLMSPNPLDKVEQTWIVDKDGGVANVVISLEPAKDKSYKVSEELKAPFKKSPAVIDQPFCMYRPHVVALLANVQQLEFKNSAKFAHNVKINAGAINPEFSKVMPPGSTETVGPYKYFPAAIVNVACDMHGWMTAKAHLFNHPYFAVSKADGTFEIKNVPIDESLTVYMWHEATDKIAGQQVKAKDGETVELKLDISASK